MKMILQSLLALAVAALCVVAFRLLAFTLYTVEGSALTPELIAGDRVVVNRWSYGLRTGGQEGLFRYGRILAKAVKRGDIVAFDSPADSLPGVFVCRCKAVAGDTVRVGGDAIVVPGREATCANEDYYWMEAIGGDAFPDSRSFGPVAESCVIGRVCMVLYSLNPSRPLYDSFRKERFFLVK